MACVERVVPAADGTPIATRTWPAASPWAHVLLVHGLGEHCGRYVHVAERLAAAGVTAHAYDSRGFGQSGGRRGHVDRWGLLHDDLAARLAAVRAGAAAPVAIYAHSLGGLLAAGYCLADRPRPDLVVLSAPALDSTLPGWKKRLAALLGRILPTLPIPNAFPGEALSRDPSVAARAEADRLCVMTTTARLGLEAMREQARVRKAAGRGLGVPTLVLHGEDDRLVPPAASLPFLAAPDTERRTYPGLRHELHNEPEGLAVVDDVLAWLRFRISALCCRT
jgi:alpha-beta hydrolase superfamily lysophospholipase